MALSSMAANSASNFKNLDIKRRTNSRGSKINQSFNSTIKNNTTKRTFRDKTKISKTSIIKLRAFISNKTNLNMLSIKSTTLAPQTISHKPIIRTQWGTSNSKCCTNNKCNYRCNKHNSKCNK